jgi:hypothetical protein
MLREKGNGEIVRRLRSEITIEASAERVWDVLTDFAAFPDWNPYLREASGKLAVGEKLAIDMRPPDGMGMTIKPKVVKIEPNREFRWLGHFLMPGIFDGEHIYEIESTGDTSCILVQREKFGGFLAPLMLAMVAKSTERGFNAMNQALKERAEGSATG